MHWIFLSTQTGRNDEYVLVWVSVWELHFFALHFENVKSFGVLTEQFLEWSLFNSFSKNGKTHWRWFFGYWAIYHAKTYTKKLLYWKLQKFHFNNLRFWIKKNLQIFRDCSPFIYGVLICFIANQVCFLKARLWTFAFLTEKKVIANKSLDLLSVTGICRFLQK